MVASSRFMGTSMSPPRRLLPATRFSIRVAIAEIYETQEKYNQAIDSYQKALEEESEGEHALLALYLVAKVYEKQEDYDKAVEALKRIEQKETAKLQEITAEWETRFKGKKKPPLPKSPMLDIVKDEIEAMRGKMR